MYVPVLRVGELRGLKWSDVDFESKTIHIRRTVGYDSSKNKFITGELKSKSGLRDIPMTQTAYDILISMKKQAFEPGKKNY